MFCDKCGTKINGGERFCSGCGTSIAQSSDVPVVKIPQEDIKYADERSKKVKRPTNKKVIIPVAIIMSIVIVAMIGLSVWLSATAPQREMKKALETNDCYTVITAFDNLMADGEYGLAHQMIVDYINDATDYLNNNFTLSVNDITEDDEIYKEIMWFLYENYGNMFVIVDEYGNFDESSLCDIEQFYEYEDEKYSIELALDNLSLMIASKYQYFEGLYELNPSFKEEDEEYYYMNALDSFSGVIKEDINYEAAQEKAKEICDEYVNSLIAKADEYIAMGDYSAAVELLNYTILDEEELDVDTNLKAKFDEVLSTYAEQYAAKAEEEFKNGDINAAVGNIEAAIAIYPNGGYEATLEKYKLYLPFELYDIKNVIVYDDVSFSYDEYAIANNGQKYYNLISFEHDDFDEYGYIQYDLEGKYNTLSGTALITLKRAYNSDFNGYFQVYGDGKLIYTSKTMRVGVKPQNFTVDVTGIKKLEIKTYSNSEYYMDIYISNFVAKKNIPTE